MPQFLKKIPYILLSLLLVLSLFLALDTFYSKNGVVSAAELHPPIPLYKKIDTQAQLDSLQNLYGHFKKIPPQFEAPILLALSHYPQLKHIPIHFTLHPKGPTPHRSQPYLKGLLLPWVQRTYFVNINEQVSQKRQPTLLKNLSFNAQVGLLGHELAHTIDYMDNSAWQIVVEAIWYALTSFKQTFEHRADSIAIAHGLGYQLQAWSEEVHPIFTADGRGHLYLSPEEVKAAIEACVLYKL